MKPLLCTLAFVLAGTTAAAAEGDDINDYLVDITGGAVSAIGLIDAKGTAITPIEASQDLIVALAPFASRDAAKNAFAFAITPAKTTLLPMSGRRYVQDWYARLAGNLTLSYAQNQTDHAGQPYKRSAFAIDTVYYLDVKDDPVYVASTAFKRCADSLPGIEVREQELNRRRQNGEISDAEFLAELARLTDERGGQLTPCIDASVAALARSRWNAARLSVSYGEGRIRPVGGGASYSLGKAFNLNAQHPFGMHRGVVQVSLRHARDAVDPDTLGTPDVAFKASRLAAVRFTHGGQDDSRLRAMVEVSSARSSAANVYKEAFVYAVGLDRKLTSGSWLELRIGRNRSAVDGREQTTALMSVNVAPTLFQFKQ